MRVTLMDAAAHSSILTFMADPQLEEITRVYSDRYDITVDQAGRVILTPKLTAAAVRRREGSRPATDEEFEAAFGDLPTGPF